MAFQRKKAQPAYAEEHRWLVDALAEAVRKRDPDKRGEGIPDILEVEQTLGDAFSVVVVWDAWKDVPRRERTPIILDAYKEARGELEMLKIMLAQGYTPEEAEQADIKL